eukprot:COSAG02_NODE_883_length_16194_cov_11.902765_6_plen_476_part_00
MATRRSRRGQAVEFEQVDEIDRKFRNGLSEARQTIDDVLPADSAQKQEALEAVKEFEDDVAATDGDEEALQEGIDSLDAFSTSIILADDVEGVNEQEVQEAIDGLNESGANVSLSAALVTDSDSDGEGSDTDSSVDEFASAAQFNSSSSEDEGSDGDTASDVSDTPSVLLAQQLAARRGALATESKEEESVRLRDQETKAERAAEQREAKRVAKQAEEDARKLEEAKAEARRRLMRQRFAELGEEVLSPIARSEVTNPGISSVVGADVGLPGTPSFRATVDPANDGDFLESPSLSLTRDDEVEQAISVLGEIDIGSSDEEVSYPGYGEETEADIDAALDSVIRQVEASVNLTGKSEDEIAGLLVNEVSRKDNMESIKDRLTDPAQASAFASATRNTPRLLKLIAQGVYAPTAFTGPTGRQAAQKIEQDLAYSEASQRKPGTRQSALPIMVRERPITSNPGIKKWKRPRFTTTSVR